MQLRDAIAMWQDGISAIFRLTKSPLIGAFISWQLSLGAVWSFFYVFIRNAAQLAANLIMNLIHHPKNTKMRLQNICEVGGEKKTISFSFGVRNVNFAGNETFLTPNRD